MLNSNILKVQVGIYSFLRRLNGVYGQTFFSLSRCVKFSFVGSFRSDFDSSTSGMNATSGQQVIQKQELQGKPLMFCLRNVDSLIVISALRLRRLLILFRSFMLSSKYSLLVACKCQFSNSQLIAKKNKQPNYILWTLIASFTTHVQCLLSTHRLE